MDSVFVIMREMGVGQDRHRYPVAVAQTFETGCRWMNGMIANFPRRKNEYTIEPVDVILEKAND